MPGMMKNMTNESHSKPVLPLGRKIDATADSGHNVSDW